MDRCSLRIQSLCATGSAQYCPANLLRRGGLAFVVCATGSASAVVCREEENTGRASATHAQHL